MEEPRKSLILACEIGNRELDARLLLGCAAAERGFRVFLGAKREINMLAMRLPRSIYLQKSLSKRTYRMYDILSRVGHWIVAGDEEGLVYYTRENYLEDRIHPATLLKARALLAWGAENADAWRAHPAFHDIPLAVTGNPRVDLLRPELRGFFDDEVKEIRARLGSFVLINTNFTHLNHFHANKSYARVLLDAAPASPQPDESFELGSARHAMVLYRAFLEMVPAMARAFPDRTFVVRPHPSENHEPWRLAAVDCPNVHVIHQGNVVPWLVAADAVIHNGCTTAMEAYCLGTPAIAYQPAISEPFDLKLPNEVSYSALDLAELRKLIDAACEGTIGDDRAEEARRHSLMDHHVTGLTGPLVSDRMAEVLDGFYREWQSEPAPSLWSRTLGRIHGRIRSLEKMVNHIRPGHTNNKSYVTHLIPELEGDDISLRLERLRNALGRFDDVRVRKIAHNVFELAT